VFIEQVPMNWVDVLIQIVRRRARSTQLLGGTEITWNLPTMSRWQMAPLF
jgi:hypothetical protein